MVGSNAVGVSALSRATFQMALKFPLALLQRTILFPSLSCRPKLCIEKCDANVSLMSKTFVVPNSSSNAATSETSTNSSSVSSKSEGDSIVKQVTPTPIEDEKRTLDTQVPNKFQDILKKSPFVKLIKYDNIEEAFINGSLEQQTNR